MAHETITTVVRASSTGMDEPISYVRTPAVSVVTVPLDCRVDPTDPLDKAVLIDYPLEHSHPLRGYFFGS